MVACAWRTGAVPRSQQTGQVDSLEYFVQCGECGRLKLLDALRRHNLGAIEQSSADLDCSPSLGQAQVANESGV